uniref:Uncharacterized protein n=1 Tax=Oryza barthii TaxID=65489 RepID=A0A0D3HK64_9ORYZ
MNIQNQKSASILCCTYQEEEGEEIDGSLCSQYCNHRLGAPGSGHIW